MFHTTHSKETFLAQKPIMSQIGQKETKSKAPFFKHMCEELKGYENRRQNMAKKEFRNVRK